MLVQVVKEERGNKGAALTTYLSLAGRYCVLMPNTARGGGISRKITQAADRKKLKEIAGEIEVPEGAGLIIRTAGAKRTKPEIKRDYEYLMRLWEQIRELTLKSIAPAKIYEEGDLIKRTIRDLYSREIDEVLVEGEGGYRTAKDFMRMIMPSHAKQVHPLYRPDAAVRALSGRGLSGRHVQPGGAAEIRRLHRDRRDRGAGGDRRELGPGDERGLDRGDRAEDQPGGRR
jgi:Rne/Rng family ribonuclease